MIYSELAARKHRELERNGRKIKKTTSVARKITTRIYKKSMARTTAEANHDKAFANAVNQQQVNAKSRCNDVTYNDVISPFTAYFIWYFSFAPVSRFFFSSPYEMFNFPFPSSSYYVFWHCIPLMCTTCVRLWCVCVLSHRITKKRIRELWCTRWNTMPY